MKVDICNNEKIIIKIQESLYSSDVVHKCMYWWSRKLDIEITKKDDHLFVSILNLPVDFDSESFLSTLRKDLIDFNTREIINRETKDIRSLLIAKAFANEDDFEESPRGSLEDTVGFSPSDFE